MAYPRLSRPGTIGSLALRNRIVKSPNTTATCNPDGTVSPRTVEHYRRLGEGGTGLVMVEYTYVDDDASKSIHGQPGASRQDHVAGLGWLADEVRSTGAAIGLQLVHCGRQRFLGIAPMKSASSSSWDVVEAPFGVRPEPLTLDEIAGVVRSFGEAAQRAYSARFDLVEIHAGHGYMITNFLSPHTNDRTDAYGGSFENRSRILLEIVDAVRARVPRDFPLSVRMSVSDYEPDGITIEESVRLARLLEEHGVDVIHASGGHHARMEWEVSSWFMPRQPHRWGWEKIRAAVSIPVIASGSLVAPDIAEEILEADSADFVSLGRAMLADPDWANKALSGRQLEIVPCIRCNDGCLARGLDSKRSVGCTVNPEVAEEGRFPVGTAPVAKRVAVAGGGAAGLRAAAVLHDRGHTVTVFEPGELGGALNHAVGSTVKQDLAALRAHLVHEVTRRGIEVRSESADASSLTGGFDEVVIATGAPQRVFTGPVADDVPALLPGEVTAHREALSGRHVVVVGGGFQGCETALRLAELPGTSVTLVESGSQLLRGDEVVYDALMLPDRLALAGVEVRTGCEALAVTEKGVRVWDAAGAEEVLVAEAAVLALGREAGSGELADAVRATGVPVSVIGSAIRPGRVYDALHTAFFAARRI